MSLRLSGGRRLQSPLGEQARPTAARVRQAVFNLLAPELAGCSWLDLCCGSGVMACEALQRGARRVVAIELDQQIAAVARANLAAVAGGLRRDPAPTFAVEQAEVLSWLGKPKSALLSSPFDLIYADPPWPADLHLAITAAIEQGQWLGAGGTLVWECPTGRVPEPPAGWRLRNSRRYGGSTVVLLEAEA